MFYKLLTLLSLNSFGDISNNTWNHEQIVCLSNFKMSGRPTKNIVNHENHVKLKS